MVGNFGTAVVIEVDLHALERVQEHAHVERPPASVEGGADPGLTLSHGGEQELHVLLGYLLSGVIELLDDLALLFDRRRQDSSGDRSPQGLEGVSLDIAVVRLVREAVALHLVVALDLRQQWRVSEGCFSNPTRQSLCNFPLECAKIRKHRPTRN